MGGGNATQENPGNEYSEYSPAVNIDQTSLSQFSSSPAGSQLTPAQLQQLSQARFNSAGQYYAPDGTDITSLATAFNSWQAASNIAAQGATKYDTLANAQPGRDQTILTGPATLLGGGIAPAPASAAFQSNKPRVGVTTRP